VAVVVVVAVVAIVAAPVLIAAAGATAEVAADGAAVGAVADAAGDGANVASDASSDASSDAGDAGDDSGNSGCDALSFRSTTLVATSQGEQAIGTLKVGQKVLAYNPQTQKMELEPIEKVWLNYDKDLVDLTLSPLYRVTTEKWPLFNKALE
jgi:hypothetical protein